MKNSLKTTINSLGLAGAIIISAGNVQASIYDYADVVKSSPLYNTVTEEKCEKTITYIDETSNHDRSNSGVGGAIGTILGGVAGGVLGNQVGAGQGKTIATIGGALGGAMIGNGIGSNSDSNQSSNRRTKQVKRVCHDVPVQKLVGYNVTYSYNGHTDTERFGYNPGSRIRVNISPANQ